MTTQLMELNTKVIATIVYQVGSRIGNFNLADIIVMFIILAIVIAIIIRAIKRKK